MGVPTMVSSPNRVQDRSHYSPISREGSVFNVNSDGVHAHLGNMTKTNASNMNLDDLVKDVMCGSNDELHILTNHHHPNPSSCSSSSNFALINGSLRKRAAAGGFEGWKDVSNGFTNPNSVSLDHETMPRGDDDDHLLDSSQLHVGIDHHQSVVVSQDWPEQLDMGVFESNFQVSSEPFFENSSIGGGVVVNGGSENDFGIPMSMPMPMQMLTASDELQTVVVEKKKKKHRYESEVMEKTDEKRQRRMIKNRESAARSRARKQAYTNQLELQVSKLREANKRLKIQQEMDMQSSSRRTILPRYQLRRSSSATF